MNTVTDIFKCAALLTTSIIIAYEVGKRTGKKDAERVIHVKCYEKTE